LITANPSELRSLVLEKLVCDDRVEAEARDGEDGFAV
jgi:hypothetical protein